MDSIPRWLQDLQRLLPIRSQFVISGNIRDHFLISLHSGAVTPAPLLRCLWGTLVKLDYQLLLVYDPIDGLRPYPQEPAYLDLATRLFNLKLKDGAMPVSLESLIDIAREVTRQREARCALVVDYASRLTPQPEQLDSAQHRFFVAAEQLSLTAHPIVPKVGELATVTSAPLYNPLIWLLNRPQDLPSWLTLDSNRIATLTIAPPDYETRSATAAILADRFAGAGEADEAQRAKFVRSFAEHTDGLLLTAMTDIAQLAHRRGIAVADVDDAIQCYKVGVLDNPWKKPYMRERIANASGFIETRVRGQRAAATKSVDILMRSVMGMTGAQARSGGTRPRGVLFFAGPTGVGKTELAKTLTQLVFGDEQAYIRFDMSEFTEEHSSARLLGAPPGYVGYEQGGELTGAVRDKPFSVVLFDEIEKAHPRILDKFLQILEDGRLTDGRGDTVYFSEAVIIFTSNLGIYVEDEQGRRVQNVQPGDSQEVVEARVRKAIQDYFTYKLSRPEILNRLGDNIVVFGFITPEIGAQIFEGMLANVVQRVQEEHKLALVMPPVIRQGLCAACTRDLSHGGRGIGNKLESYFINPLSRALFLMNLEGRSQVTVSSVRQEADRTITVTLS